MRIDGFFINILLLLNNAISTELYDNTQETTKCVFYNKNKNSKSNAVEQEADYKEEITKRNSFLSLGSLTKFINDTSNVEKDEIEQFLNYSLIKTLKELKGISLEISFAIGLLNVDRTTILNLLNKSIDLIDPFLNSLKSKEDKNLEVFQDYIEKICSNFQDLYKLFKEVEELYEEKEKNRSSLDLFTIISNIIYLKDKMASLSNEFDRCKDFQNKICLLDHIKKIQFLSEHQSNMKDMRTMIENMNNDELKEKSAVFKISFFNTTSLVYDILLEVLNRENMTVKCHYKTLDNILLNIVTYFENLESLKETLIKN